MIDIRGGESGPPLEVTGGASRTRDAPLHRGRASAFCRAPQEVNLCKYINMHKIPVFRPLATIVTCGCMAWLQGGRVLAWLLEELGRMKAPCAGIPGVDGTGPPGAGYALQTI